ncbi:MAG: peptide chain release factor N(5)-glutamine methyltransferase, partial [Oscillospiraceae bacterium]|nr:peptide chain release factor N(5)-glutamine methyltransferase [Oscillospiraceae bacterium]
SGCIALALKKYLVNAEITGIDISTKALSYANQNKNYHALSINFMLGDVLDNAIAEKFDNIDLIISNPPYLTSQEMANLQKEVSFEPVSALAGGLDGLDFYQNITDIWKHKLKQNGLLIYEIGCQQAEAVAEILKINDFKNIQVIQDLENRNRVVLGFKN